MVTLCHPSGSKIKSCLPISTASAVVSSRFSAEASVSSAETANDTTTTNSPRNAHDADTDAKPSANIIMGKIKSESPKTPAAGTTVSPQSKTPSHDSDPEEVQERAWKCHGCSRHNHLHTIKCPKCSSWKGRKRWNTRTSTVGCELVWGVERHDDECAVCGYGGELICCDKCDKVYHGNCLQVKDASTLLDPWHCPACDPYSDENKKMQMRIAKKEGEDPVTVKSEPKVEPMLEQGDDNEDVKNEKKYCRATRKKRKTGCNDDECYICADGGMLICCDYCEKSFHMECHVPPLLYPPEGKKWKCCECAASSYGKRFKCGQCKACLKEDCGECAFCLDKRKFGGRVYLKQVCIHKQCPFKRYAPTATVTPEMKKTILAKEEDNDADESPVALFASAAQELGNGNAIMAGEEGPDGNAVTNARRSKRAHKPSRKAKEGVRDNNSATAAGKRKIRKVTQYENSAEIPARGSKSDGSTEASSAEAGRTVDHGDNANEESDAKPADSVEVPARHDMDDHSQATLPFLSRDNVNAADDNDAPSDLVMCQMELKRARAEICRLDSENKRLKSAVKALSASLTG